AVAPVLADGKVVGVVDIGTELSNAYFTPIAERIGAEISVNVVQDGKLVNQSSTDGGKPFLSDEILRSAFDGASVFEQTVLDNRDMLIKAVPFTSFACDKIGVFE
ncbi:methyl-accepting chemotaxis protein, partial [Mesorhizobium sp. M1D.F.Ca.ET.184.01.1.1]|uniref:cache domain-containing protein n=1 Tax=Mesorhizobium sp. M1D.F.Ca.ET.184.01.1.1 TaxID=2563931 RepID=UPI0011359848